MAVILSVLSSAASWRTRAGSGAAAAPKPAAQSRRVSNIFFMRIPSAIGAVQRQVIGGRPEAEYAELRSAPNAVSAGICGNLAETVAIFFRLACNKSAVPTTNPLSRSEDGSQHPNHHGENIMKKQNLVSLAIGSAFAAVALTPVVHAADNPFAAKQLSAGYQLAQADKKMDGKCGEAKCGADKAKGKCGKAADKKADGKCGEAKCGAKK
jgi:uncharacterized low-complexity protein